MKNLKTICVPYTDTKGIGKSRPIRRVPQYKVRHATEDFFPTILEFFPTVFLFPRTEFSHHVRIFQAIFLQYSKAGIYSLSFQKKLLQHGFEPVSP